MSRRQTLKVGAKAWTLPPRKQSATQMKGDKRNTWLSSICLPRAKCPFACSLCWNEASHRLVSLIISVSDCILSWLVDLFFLHLLVTYYSLHYMTGLFWGILFGIYAAVIFGDVWVKDFWRARRPVKRREPEPSGRACL